MAANRKEVRTGVRRAFRPTLGDTLEGRTLLSGLQNTWVHGSALAPGNRLHGAAVVQNTAATARTWNPARLQLPAGRLHAAPHAPHFRFFTFGGGQGVRIISSRGGAFDVQIIGTGTVRAAPLANGTVKIDALGTNPQSELVFDPVVPSAQLGRAHMFLPQYGVGSQILPVGQINVTSGRIGQISGFRTVDLYGPINILDSFANPNDAPRVDRIALNSMKPGSSIRVVGDLDTLDVFTGAELIGSGSGVFVGRDLNWANIRGDLKLGNGGAVIVGRDLGLTAQPSKGSGVGGVGLQVQGDLLIDAASGFTVQRDQRGPVIVYGDFIGTSRFLVAGQTLASTFVLGQQVAAPAPVVLPTSPNFP